MKWDKWCQRLTRKPRRVSGTRSSMPARYTATAATAMGFTYLQEEERKERKEGGKRRREKEVGKKSRTSRVSCTLAILTPGSKTWIVDIADLINEQQCPYTFICLLCLCRHSHILQCRGSYGCWTQLYREETLKCKDHELQIVPWQNKSGCSSYNSARHNKSLCRLSSQAKKKS